MKRGPERLGDFLGEAVVKPARRSRSLLVRATRKWRGVACESLAAHSVPRGFRRGVLTVEVDSSALLAELSAFRRAQLERAMAAGDGPVPVREIRFVLGGQR